MGRWTRFLTNVRAMAGRVFAFVKEPSRTARQKAEFDVARREFHFQRERLEAKFFELAASSGKPRGLRWSECEFENDVTYARQRSGGRLCAFVAVTISFEAIEGGMMEGVEAVGNLRAATAVFHRNAARWDTDGRALFNLSPSEAISYYQDNLVMVGHEPAVRA
ncbi:MAG TPA: hypothetical protein VHZ24_00490 [Pirellulales bacterium]|nr:hypothetical protein [Pirellulales bacterium]